MESAAIAVPYNMVKVGDIIVGLDGFFWDQVEVKARRVLLIKPLNKLEGGVEPGYIVLKPRIQVGNQVNDLIRLRDEITHMNYMRAARLGKWRLLRFIGIPVSKKRLEEDNPRYEEERYAYLVLGALRLEEAEPQGVAWLNLEISSDSNGLTVASKKGGVDRYYTWLAGHDGVFRRALLSTFKKRG